MEHSKMRKDASVLRNHDFWNEIVELDVGFHVVVSKVRKNVSFSRYRNSKTKTPPSESQTRCKVFSTCLARSFHFFHISKKKLCPAKRSILWNIRKCARMPTFEEIVKKLGRT